MQAFVIQASKEQDKWVDIASYLTLRTAKEDLKIWRNMWVFESFTTWRIVEVIC